LELRSGVLRGTPSQITIEVEGVELEVDFLRGHKTGLYLDQKHNYGIVTGYARDPAPSWIASQTKGHSHWPVARAGATKVTAIEEKFGEYCRRETKMPARNDLKVGVGAAGCISIPARSRKKQAHSMI